MPRPDAVVAGHICLDVIPRLPPIDVRTDLRPGAVIEIGPAILATGGPVSNTGRNLHRLGIRTLLMGKVGDDAFGHLVLRQLCDDDPALADIDQLLADLSQLPLDRFVGLQVPQGDHRPLVGHGADQEAAQAPQQRISGAGPRGPTVLHQRRDQEAGAARVGGEGPPVPVQLGQLVDREVGGSLSRGGGVVQTGGCGLFEGQLGSLRSFISDYRWPILAVSVVLVGLSMWSDRRGGRDGISDLAHLDDDIAEIEAEHRGGRSDSDQ